jgi:hypothetical protein
MLLIDILRLIIALTGVGVFAVTLSSLARRKMTESFCLTWGLVAVMMIIAGLVLRPYGIADLMSVTALVVIVVIGYVVYKTVKIVRMSPEERKKTLIVYIKGVVAAAERELGAGQGAVKLEQVEAYFNKNAGWFLKILLVITKTENLKDLIETALKEIKEDFGGA